MTNPQPSPPHSVRVGQIAAARYRLLRLLGSGGMGEVYEAEHVAVGKRVAVKCLWPALWSDPEQVERFEREARVASIVQSPYVVDVMDAGRLEDGAPFLVTELLEGMTLAQHLADRGTLPIDRVVGIVRQVATGLAAAHSAGIVHRDLKPENVFLAVREGVETVKILDFGVSKFRREELSQELTRTGAAIGTPAYMSPEQIEGMRDVDARADVWSLGVMLFRMLVGELPFVADSYARMLVRIISDDQAPRVRTRNPEIPRDLDAIVARCLEKSPAGRYLSMTELLAALPRGAAPAGDTARAADHLAPTSPRESTDSGTRESPGGSAPVATGAPTVVARPGSGATPATRAPQPSSRSATPPTRQPPQPIAPASPGRVAPSSGSQPLGSATPARSPIPRAPAATAPPIVRGGPSSAGAPFDAVVLTDGPRPRRVSAEEFFALPLSARIQHVISRTVTFLKDGVEVDRQEALARMRERFAK